MNWCWRKLKRYILTDQYIYANIHDILYKYVDTHSPWLSFKTIDKRIGILTGLWWQEVLRDLKRDDTWENIRILRGRLKVWGRGEDVGGGDRGGGEKRRRERGRDKIIRVRAIVYKMCFLVAINLCNPRISYWVCTLDIRDIVPKLYS